MDEQIYETTEVVEVEESKSNNAFGTLLLIGAGALICEGLHQGGKLAKKAYDKFKAAKAESEVADEVVEPVEVTEE